MFRPNLPKPLDFPEFPVDFPVTREISDADRFKQTASATTQSKATETLAFRRQFRRYLGL
jgi:hypothetical protein